MSEEVELRRTLRRVEREIVDRPDEIAVVVARTGIVLFTRTGAHNYVALDDVQIGEWRGAYLTHNHPGGRSFSPQDVLMLLTTRLAEVRAVSEQYEYSLLLPDDEWEDVEDLVGWVSRRIADNDRIAFNTEGVSPDTLETTFWHRVWLEIAEIRGWQYRRQERRR